MAQDQLFVQMALLAWETNISRADSMIGHFSDEQLMKEIAPGKNRGIYLLGHLVAVHDAMCDILELGERHYPFLTNIFLSSPDRSGLEMPTVSKLREYWTETNQRLAGHFNRLSPDEWLEKHHNISAEDFLKEPHRNKLAVLINRTGHLAYHTGQLVLLKK
ncbi:MAG TPA: DinB family protein [Puia sp.]|nr:DinB family protein [Puia sp.]